MKGLVMGDGYDQTVGYTPEHPKECETKGRVAQEESDYSIFCACKGW